MPVPALITDLNISAALNSPAGTESIGANMDNYVRAHAAFIAQLQANKFAVAGGTITGDTTLQKATPRLSIIATDANPCQQSWQKSATWNYQLDADVTSWRLGVVGSGFNSLYVLITGYAGSATRFAINGKTPVAAVAAPAVATDLATSITAVNAIRTALINFGIFI